MLKERSTNTEAILCFVCYKAAGNFFLRLANSIDSVNFIFITNIASFYKECKRLNITCHLLDKSSTYDEEVQVKTEDLNMCREVFDDYYTADVAKKFYQQAYFLSVELIKEFKNVITFNWGQHSIFSLVSSNLKTKFETKTLYFELANIPGKIFVDHQGVNASSSLFSKPELLSTLEEDSNFDYEDWRRKFIGSKLGKNTPPPQVKLGKSINISMFYDFIYSLTFGYRFYSYNSILSKSGISSLLNSLTKKNSNISYSNIDELTEKYVFFPMQVSNDSQILINSNVDNLQALEHIIESLPTDMSVVIKPHPAERDIRYIFDFVSELEDSSRVFLSNENTYKLIDNADSVTVINSTVGFEAMLFGKNVTFLGKSYFSKISKDQISKYLGAYLVSENFFGSDYLSELNVINIINRAK